MKTAAGQARKAMTQLSELDLLRAVRDEEITWNRESWRRWSDEDNYVLVTKVMPALEAQGLVGRHMAPGFGYVRRGYVELTPAGRRRLSELEQSDHRSADRKT